MNEMIETGTEVLALVSWGSQPAVPSLSELPVSGADGSIPSCDQALKCLNTVK